MSFANTVPQGPTIPPSGNFSSLSVSGMIDMNDAIITNVGDPIDNKDAANKEYVDTHGGGGTGIPNSVAYYDSLGHSSSITQVKSNGTTDLVIGTNSEWFQGPKLIGTDAIGSAGSQGTSTFITGDYAIVGGTGDNNSIGAAWGYQKIDGIWTQINKLVPNDNIGEAQFGTSCFIVDNGSTQTALIGGPDDNSGVGAVWAFQNTGSGWSQVSKISPTDYIGLPHFGYSVSMVMSGGTYFAVIGGASDNTSIGAVWIYQSSDGITWSENTKIVPDDNIGQSLFGTSTSAVFNQSKFTLVIGGGGDNSNYGAAWIYQSTNGVSWTKLTKIIPPEGGAFGWSVSLSFVSNVYNVAIGAYGANSTIGLVYIYTSTGGVSWSQDIVLSPTDNVGTSTIFFGISVSIYNNSLLAIGGFGDDNFKGACWLYQNTISGWSELVKLVPENIIADIAYAGCSCSLDNTELIFGGLASGSGEGASWIYSYSINSLTIENGGITAPGTIQASVISDGYGATMNGGIVSANLVQALNTESHEFNANIMTIGTLTVVSDLISIDAHIGSADSSWLQGPKLQGIITDPPSGFQQAPAIISGAYVYTSNADPHINEVYVYMKTDGSSLPFIWSKIDTISESGGIGTNIGFGSSLSAVLDGNTQSLLVGASGDNSGIGAVWFFQNTGSGWNQLAKIVPPDNIGDSNFGSNASLVFNSGTYTAAIAGTGDNNNAGAVWIYQSTDGSTWNEITKIVASDEIGNAYFGTGVSLVNTGSTYTFSSGGPSDNSGIGAVWIYQSTTGGGSGWTEKQKLIPTDNSGPAQFGIWTSMYITGTTSYMVAIGGPQDSSSRGSTWVYNSTGGASWSEMTKLAPANPIGGFPVYGCYVSLYGTNLIVGGYGDDNFRGAAWLYKIDGTNFDLISKIVPANPIGPISYFGYVCNISDDTAVICGPVDGGVGSTWIYDYTNTFVEINSGNIAAPGTVTGSILSDGYGTVINGGVVESNFITDGFLMINGGQVIGATITDSSNIVAAKSLVTNTGSMVSVNGNTPTTNYVLTATSSSAATWQPIPSPGPVGYNTQIQYNNDGVLAGNPGLIYTGTDLDVSTWTQLTMLTGTTDNSYGQANATNGTDAIVGEPSFNGTIGTAFSYKRNGNYWVSNNTLSFTGQVGPNASFGCSVSIVGTIALIGGQSDSSSIGSVWVFKNTGTWGQIAKITPPDGIGPNVFFGCSTALYYDGSRYTALIGGQLDNNGLGAAWIYQSPDAVTWTEIIKIVPGDGIGSSRFGISVSIGLVGTTYTAVIGGYNDNNQTGAVWVYQGVSNGTTSGDWSEVTKIAGQVSGQGNFGVSISLYGDGTDTYTFVTGATNVPTTGLTTGVAYVYRSINAGLTWNLVATLLPYGTTDGGNSGVGTSCSIYQDVIMVASFYKCSVFVYRQNNGNWQYEYTINPDSDSGGMSVSLTQLNGVYTSMIGAVGNPGNGNAWGYDDLVTDINGYTNTNGVLMAPNSIGTASSNFTVDFVFNCRQGIITLTPITMTNGATHSQTVGNSFVNPDSIIFVSMLEVGGISNCFAVNASSVTNGAFDLNLCNVGPSVSGITIKISFMTIN
jgi:hypothetical protein